MSVIAKFKIKPSSVEMLEVREEAEIRLIVRRITKRWRDMFANVTKEFFHYRERRKIGIMECNKKAKDLKIEESKAGGTLLLGASDQGRSQTARLPTISQ